MSASSGDKHMPLSKRRPIDTVIRPFQEFASLETSGGLILIATTVLALLWANSPWSASYFEIFRKTYFTIGIGAAKISKPLLLWINDGLMAVFFLLVGLEIKREILTGELASLRKATLPIAAAIGGMVIPALIYASFNFHGEGAAGWGIPMATDIAFALGVISLAGKGIPTKLKVFLVAFAIVDDLGAVLVIALFYTESIQLTALAIGLAGLLLALLIGRLGVRSLVPFMLLGIPIWVAFLISGLHATIAGVLLAMTIPHRALLPSAGIGEAGEKLINAYRTTERDGDEEGRHSVLTSLHHLAKQTQSPLVRLEHGLHPLVTWIILPLFALSNAGVSFSSTGSGALATPVGLGILFGLFLGKQVGVFGAAWLSVRLKIAEKPAGVSWRHLYGAGLLGGIGFTMSLFIGGLAFGEGTLLETAKFAILVASLISGILGWWLLRTKTART